MHPAYATRICDPHVPPAYAEQNRTEQSTYEDSYSPSRLKLTFGNARERTTKHA